MLTGGINRLCVVLEKRPCCERLNVSAYQRSCATENPHDVIASS